MLQKNLKVNAIPENFHAGFSFRYEFNTTELQKTAKHLRTVGILFFIYFDES